MVAQCDRGDVNEVSDALGQLAHLTEGPPNLILSRLSQIVPQYEHPESLKSRVPDFRNVLIWEPDIKVGKDGKCIVEFYTSDDVSAYEIWIEGISSDGLPGHTSTMIEVTADL